jgi:membrane fusion protein, multidrug efflux system
LRHMPIIAVAGFLALTGAAYAQMPGGPGGPAGPTEVGVVTVHPQAVPFSTELAGRVVASKVVEIRPQVGGIVKAIDFKDGATVKAGDVLFEIDDASYKAQVDVAKATLQKDQAGVTSAQAKYDRYVKLGANVSTSDLDDAHIALVQAQADAASASASLQAAEINLGFTKVVAPISGLISESSVTQGALVTAAQSTALATVRLLDPIYVDLVDTSTNLLKIRAQFEAGDLKGGPKDGKPVVAAPVVHLTLEDGSTYPETGELTLANVVVSESTGTFTLRATFANPDRVLLPGMFVRASVDLGSNPNGFLVPQRAVTFNAAGEPTVLVAKDGKAVTQVLTTNGSRGNAWIVTGGIKGGDQVIVDGLQKVSAGSEVKPVEVTIGDDGAIVQTIKDTAVAPAGK